ncbi:MAG: hypothetical protein LAT82_02640 [Nanoarchaeota archaeon]|nr:hypothetical protein [Nanoarchaeota archaeon]
MGNDKTPLTDPQVFTFHGVFDPHYVYSGMKSFLETTKNYDGTEKKMEETKLGETYEMVAEFMGEAHLSDHIHLEIELEFEMEGKEVIVVDKEGVEHIYLEGEATLEIFSFIVKNENKHRHDSPLVEFVNKIFQAYYNTSEMKMLSKKAKKDVSETITRFKQLTNMTTRGLN